MTFINICYFLTAILFILGLKKMSSPTTAAGGIRWAGYGMVLATAVTLFHPHISGHESAVTNYVLIILALGVGGGLSWYSGKKVKTTDLPQMIALYNGMGGGAAAAIAAVELLKMGTIKDALKPATQAMGEMAKTDIGRQLIEQSQVAVDSVISGEHLTLGLIGAFIGTIAFSGSIIAWAKLDGRMKKSFKIPQQNLFNLGLFAATILFGVLSYYTLNPAALFFFFALALTFGVTVTTPIGGADMPVIISLFNALTGLAVAFEGFVLGNAAMIIAGTVVGSAGSLLTQLMAKAMNRSLANVLFSGFGTEGGEGSHTSETGGEMKAIDAEDVGVMMAYAEQVIIIPGYGMAVAQAQHKVWELAKLLIDRDVKVKFAIHPVAGRMPGHMNVLLAEAGVPYDVIYDMEDINSEFKNSQVALVIGANDVVNPSAKNDPTSDIYGMPVLDVEDSDNVIVIKRGRGVGFSGIENPLFFGDKTRMLFGDGQEMAAELIQAVKQL